MGDGDLAITDLNGRMGLAADLSHGLDRLRHSTAVGGMVVAQPPAVGVERQTSVGGHQAAVGHELPAFALLAETEVFDGLEHGDGEGVVDRRVVDVLRRDPRLGERPRPRPRRAGEGEIGAPVHGVLGRLAVAQDLDAPGPDGLGDLGRGHHHRSPAVGDHTAVEPVERIGHERRREHVLHRDGVGQVGVGVVLRVLGRRHLDPRQLLGSGPELVHVPARRQRVHTQHVGSVEAFEAGLGRGGEGGDGVGGAARAGSAPATEDARARGSRLPGQRHEGDAALPRGDGCGCVTDVDVVRRATGLGGVDVGELVEAEIIGHRHRAEAGGVAGAEVAVDVVEGEPGVGQRAQRHLGVDLRQRPVGDLAPWVLVSAHDEGLASDGHDPDWTPRLPTSNLGSYTYAVKRETETPLAAMSDATRRPGSSDRRRCRRGRPRWRSALPRKHRRGAAARRTRRR